ncbi:hypothetical protein B0H34DRAFT_848503 [Crassisporium funariophilum]|nr:hypothetical protein B0H34DRAFT_848503 [Crassisporium funariophilum]
MVDLISHHQARKRKREDDAHKAQDRTPLRTPSRTLSHTPASSADIHIESPTYTPVRRGINALASTSASFLVSDSPIASTSRLPALRTFEISPHVTHHSSAIDFSKEPPTEREKVLITALEVSYQRNAHQKDAMTGMQAQGLLQAAYVEDVRGQLQSQEERKKQGKKKGRIRVNTDGKSKILTQDSIFNAVVEGQVARDAAKEAASKRKDAKERYTDAVGIWKVRDMDRKVRNALCKEGWIKDIKKWEVERDSAKYEKRKPRWQKPKMPPMEKAMIKPKVADFVEGNGEEDEDEDEEDGERSDLGGGSDND